MENIALSDRGFKGGKFVDQYDKKCSIQESSKAAIEGDGEGHCIWFGVDEVEILKDVRTGPGIPVVLDDTHTVFSHMHLSQRQVKELIPHLQYFAESGWLPTPDELTAFEKHMEPMSVLAASYFNEVSS